MTEYFTNIMLLLMAIFCFRKKVFAKECDVVFEQMDKMTSQAEVVHEWDLLCAQSQQEIDAFWHSEKGTSKAKRITAVEELRAVTKKDWYKIRGMAVSF